MKCCNLRECILTILSTCGFTLYLYALSVYTGSAFLPPTPPPHAYSAIMKSVSWIQDGTDVYRNLQLVEMQIAVDPGTNLAEGD